YFEFSEENMKNIFKYLIQIIVIIVVFFNNSQSYCQARQLSEQADDGSYGDYTFESPRPLVTYSEKNKTVPNVWGADMLLSNNGFGMGIFYQHIISGDLYFFSSLYMSGARNTDEYEIWDDPSNSYVVPGKVNRIFMFPLTVGIQQYIFTEELSESMRPFINLGIGPTFIVAAPYRGYEFFESFGEAITYTRPSAFVGAGVNIYVVDDKFLSINMRYYYTPFGDKGLESVTDSPITDFGGLFLSISMGAKY
ncbi:MAG: hypothetical protein KAH48_10065, partial [Chlorobi bacterium]|nr:hypothetical protein [Chlorobiota bacterium]